MDDIIIDGITVRIVKKRIKNMYLRINKNGECVVSAPIFTPHAEIESFVYSKAEWLKAAIQRMKQKTRVLSLFDEGEKRSFLGRQYTLHIDTNRERGYYFDGNDIVICVGKNSTLDKRKKALAEVYRNALEQILPDMVNDCQQKCGLYADEWRIRDMTTRWGSCNTQKKRIWISLWLVEKPVECINGVIYHELTHLKVKGHNKEFYTLLEKNCPYYKKVDKILKNK